VLAAALKRLATAQPVAVVATTVYTSWDSFRTPRTSLNGFFQKRPYERVRAALIAERGDEEDGFRLREIRERVEARLGHPLDYYRFRDYVTFQSSFETAAGATPLRDIPAP
jgi:hypothetical protein